jgi:hypothetical protein
MCNHCTNNSYKLPVGVFIQYLGQVRLKKIRAQQNYYTTTKKKCNTQVADAWLLRLGDMARSTHTLRLNS